MRRQPPPHGLKRRIRTILELGSIIHAVSTFARMCSFFFEIGQQTDIRFRFMVIAHFVRGSARPCGAGDLFLGVFPRIASDACASAFSLGYFRRIPSGCVWWRAASIGRSIL